MTPEHREMPLTLAFSPEKIGGKPEDDQLQPIVLVQPSAEEEGRIFIGVNPFGKAVGCHVLPEDAARIRDHLAKLLLEPSDAPYDEDAPLPPEPDEGSFMERRGADIAKAAAATQRFRRPRRLQRAREGVRRALPQFRLEFKWGSFEALLIRVRKSGP